MRLSEIILLIGAMLSLYLLLKNVFNIVFALENYNMHKKRLKQLQFKRKEEMGIGELVDVATTPVLKYIFPKLKLKSNERLDEEIRFAKWDKYINAEKYYALSVTLKVIATLLFLLLKPYSTFLAFMWFLPVFFLFDILFRVALKEKSEELIKEFPGFIRKVSGYISAGLTIEDSFKSSIKYVGPQWAEIAKSFVVEAEIKGVSSALAKLKDATPVFEVKEFAGLISLSLQRTGNVQESFENQIEKIKELQERVLLAKIAKREMMTLLIQMPLLLSSLAIIIAPTIYNFTNISM